MSDWQLDRNYYANRYDTEFNRDYGMYRDQVADAENNRNFWAGLYDMEHDNDFGEYQSDVAESQWEQEFSHNKEMDAAELAIAQAQLKMQQEQWEMEKAKAASSGRSSSGSRRSSSKKSTSDSDKPKLSDFDLGLALLSGYSDSEIKNLIKDTTSTTLGNPSDEQRLDNAAYLANVWAHEYEKRNASKK